MAFELGGEEQVDDELERVRQALGQIDEHVEIFVRFNVVIVLQIANYIH